MHAFLINNPPDIPHSPDVLNIRPEKSIGIEEIRQIQSFLSRKPMQSPNNTVIIHDAHLMTLPAQNAILKILEEPPGDSLIYLITSYLNLLIPTVLSRVQIIDSPNLSNLPNSPNLTKTQDLLQKLQTTKVGERLQIIESQNFTRESALEFLSDLEHLSHQEIVNSQLSTVHYDLISQTRKYLKANCSVKLTMDNFAIHLSAW